MKGELPAARGTLEDYEVYMRHMREGRADSSNLSERRGTCLLHSVKNPPVVLHACLSGATLTPAEAALVIGGEAVLFGEYADETNVDPQVLTQRGCR
jgi:hypothetical protein